ncbi:hypothetical protein LFL97_40510 (plasmid) [Burkholderia sp. JSH-S8]|uniref:hypothetical protein n=1 Tax=Burkholderia stagnalis TaxID=1503054 RepID=UPI001F4980EC|nr:hypothetical protein [Burkholderia stagnalis]WGS47438.1 hypothetical protein LFL97_40510 [Burkholderia sp. JSH-S8]
MTCLLATGLVAACAAAATPDTAHEVSRGRALFVGAAALTGRLSTHPADLPEGAVRCANCHAVGRSASVSRSIAPRLTGMWLSELQARRGGPPSSYDRADFCALLRTGIDPAHVLINVAMPRYRISDRDCTALWCFISKNQ